MKNIFLPLFSAIILNSCGGTPEQEVIVQSNLSEKELIKNFKKTNLSEKELIKNFKESKLEFKKIFNNPSKYNQEDLAPLTDSMAYFVNALISEHPSSNELAKVLCEAGVSCLNSRDGKRSVKYLTYLKDSFPNDSLVPKAMYFIGRTKEVLFKDLEGAKNAYEKLYRAFPKTNWSEIARSSIMEISNPTLLESVDNNEELDTVEIK